jgi:hypothetical protein
MKPTTHSVASVRRYGGVLEDYLDIHEFLDMTKAAHPDMRHRAILHNTMGPFIAAKVFGTHYTNSAGRMVDVRQVCEDHIIEDLGRLPTVSSFLDLIPEDKMNQFAYSKSQRQRRAD